MADSDSNSDSDPTILSQFRTNFHILRMLLFPVLIPGNFPCDSWPTVNAYVPNFIWIRLLCHLPGTKETQLWENVDIWGLPYPAPHIDKGEIWYARVDPRSTLMCQIASRSVYSVSLGRRKPPNFAVFRLWRHTEKVECRYKTTNLPYLTVSKSFLYSNGFMMKSCAQNVVHKRDVTSVTDTSTQTKNSFIVDPLGRKTPKSPSE